MTGFPDKPSRLETALLAGIAGAAGLAGAAPIAYSLGKGRRNEARAAAFKARQRKKRKRK